MAAQRCRAACRWVLRGGEEVRAAAEAALRRRRPGAGLPRSALPGERAALWLGPDEWLLIAPLTQSGLATRLERALAALAALAGRRQPPPGGARGARRRGRDAARRGCPLDLDAAAFPVGMCTRTMLAKAEVVLWRLGACEFRIEVWRSFAPYVSQYLAEAARGIN